MYMVLIVYVTASCEVFTSQIPSQASNTNCASEVMGTILTSGNGETTWSFGLNIGLFLYSKSPSALESANIPLTLPSSTNPPAFWILRISFVSSGLWSWESSTAVPFFARTVRESPALAHMISVFVTRMTVAVHPAKLLAFSAKESF